MMKRYSEFTKEQLTEEIERLQREIEKAESSGQEDVLRQKVHMAKSYLMKGVQFPEGDYRVEGDGRLFRLERLNGVMAWGTWENGEEGAVPISALLLP